MAADERELKLDLPVGVALPPLEGVAGVAAVRRLDDQRLDARYWDTEALDLLAVGATLRRRTGGSAVARWTLKVKAATTGAGALLERVEHDVDDPSEEPPAVLVAQAAAVAGAPLVPVGRLVTHRRRLVLVDAAGAALAEVDDDEVLVEVDDREPLAFREVEVELGPAGDLPLLEVVAARLVEAGAVAADPTPKLARGLAHRLDRGQR